ncbi:MAG TPA: SurA N-terminal domain-containing protein [Terriglobales bacterium]|nr:SurA N-terminal domain-containing protein [Terriglobales bacterium]
MKKIPSWQGVSLILVTAFLFLAASCGSKDGKGEVMATIDGRKIYREEVDKYYRTQTAGSAQQPIGEQATSLRLSILRQLIDTEIVMRRAEKLGLLATDDEVDRRITELKAPYTNEEFDARLKERQITLDDFKREIRRQLTMDKVLNKEITSKISISDQDINDYYKAHTAEFNFVEPQYHLARILVSPIPNPQAPNNKAQNDTEAKKKIQTILNRLDSGDDFATLAANFSEDTETAANGGDLGFIPESSLKNTDPTTRESVSKLQPGQHTPIIPWENPATKQLIGYQIVKLVSKEPAGQRTLSDPRVKEAIRSQLRDRREQLLKAAYDEAMHDQAKVENFYAQKVLEANGAVQ